MREIIFRGKRIDNGDWVEGDFCRPCNIVTIEKDYDEVLKREDEICGDYSVIPETVGEFTGLYDKKGKQIFEGDIVIRDECLKPFIGYVVFEKDVACFKIISNKTDHSVDLNFSQQLLTVFGNIFDNLKFLKK